MLYHEVVISQQMEYIKGLEYKKYKRTQCAIRITLQLGFEKNSNKT